MSQQESSQQKQSSIIKKKPPLFGPFKTPKNKLLLGAAYPDSNEFDPEKIEFQFSEDMKHSELILDRKNMRVGIPSDTEGDDLEYKVGLVEPALQNDKVYVFQYQIKNQKNLKGNNIGFGICKQEIIEGQEYKFNREEMLENHGLYMLFGDGYILSDHQNEINSFISECQISRKQKQEVKKKKTLKEEEEEQKNQFEFEYINNLDESNLVISCKFDPVQKTLVFQIGFKQFTMKLKINKNDKINICIAMSKGLNQEKISETQSQQDNDEDKQEKQEENKQNENEDKQNNENDDKDDKKNENKNNEKEEKDNNNNDKSQSEKSEQKNKKQNKIQYNYTDKIVFIHGFHIKLPMNNNYRDQNGQVKLGKQNIKTKPPQKFFQTYSYMPDQYDISKQVKKQENYQNLVKNQKISKIPYKSAVKYKETTLYDVYKQPAKENPMEIVQKKEELKINKPKFKSQKLSQSSVSSIHSLGYDPEKRRTGFDTKIFDKMKKMQEKIQNHQQ